MKRTGEIATAWWLLFFAFAQIGMAAPEGKTTVRGWLSDEKCAKSRASNGTYTATGLTCGKQCIAQGQKIALIDPAGKRVLVIENQAAAKKNFGNYVEITGVVDPRTSLLHIDSLKFLDKNRPVCGVPQKQPKTSQN